MYTDDYIMLEVALTIYIDSLYNWYYLCMSNHQHSSMVTPTPYNLWATGQLASLKHPPAVSLYNTHADWREAMSQCHPEIPGLNAALA